MKGLAAPCARSRLCGRCANVSPSPVCLRLSFCVCFKSSPQNRPLIIVWCTTGSAVRSYKQAMGVFIAGREREAGARLYTGRSQRRGEDRDLLSRPCFPPERRLLLLLQPSRTTWGPAGGRSCNMTPRCPAMTISAPNKHIYIMYCFHGVSGISVIFDSFNHLCV